MLEDLAIQYVFHPEDMQRLISLGMIIAGAIIAAIFHKSSGALQRAAYFAYSAILTFIAAASQLVWLGSIPAMTGGFLWVFMLVDVVVGLFVGYCFGIIAMARSRDAYGHPRLAFLAFIPIANFWLLFTRSKSELSADRTPTIMPLTGVFGVLTGFVFLFASIVLTAVIEAETNRMIAIAEDDPATQRAGIDMMLRGQGLEETLRQIAAEVPSQRVDERTILLGVSSEGTTLRYVYEVSTDSEALPMSMRMGLIQANCNLDALRPLIEAGTVIEHLYQRTNGAAIGVVTVTRDICSH